MVLHLTDDISSDQNKWYLSCYYLFFTGQIDYARLVIISSSVG